MTPICIGKTISMATLVFVDTEAHYALADVQDPDHAEAVRLLQQIVRLRYALVTRNFVISEAIRKHSSTVVHILSSIRAVVKRGATTRGKPVQHKIDITHLYHGSTGLYSSCIVLAVSTIPTMPGVCALNHPAFLQGREAFRALRTHFDFDAPPLTMLGHPGVEGVMVILLIRKDRTETRKVTWRELSQQLRGRHAAIQPGTGDQNGE